MALSKNFEDLFIKPDSESNKWSNKLFELGEKGDLSALIEHFEDDHDTFMLETAQIHSALSEFTLNSPYSQRIKLIKKLKNDKKYDVKFDKNRVFIKSDDIDIKAFKLSYACDFVKYLFPDIETSDRLGNCHNNSIELALAFSNPNTVVTGYIYNTSRKCRFLHSWIETKINNKDMVIDCTMNIIMNKDGYYKLKYAEPLNSISNKDLKEDLNMIFLFSNKIQSINQKEYLVFRDEIMKDINKNKGLFDSEFTISEKENKKKSEYEDER